jgi:hypothetical protein
MSRAYSFLPCCVALLLGWLAAYAPAAVTEGADKSKAEELKTRTFQVPRDFLRVDEFAGEPTVLADPFAPPAERMRKPGEPVPLIKTARDHLTEAGITFPPGASASLAPFSGTLTVVNTQANQELCEAYLESSSTHYPHHMTFMLTVLEGPGEIIRAANAAAAGQQDVTPVLAGLMQQAGKAESQVRVVQDACMEAKSGMRATARSVKEHVFTVASMDAQSHLSSTQEMQMAGMNLEFEPVIDSDGQHIQFNCLLELNPAAPKEKQVAFSDPATGNPAEVPLTTVPALRFSADIQMLSGSTRLLGISKPYGKTGAESDDVLWAAFLTSRILRLDGVALARPDVKAAPLKVPAGMQKLALPLPPGLLENMRQHARQTLQECLDMNGVAPAAGADAVVQGGVLTVVNTPENIERIVALVDYLSSKLPKTVALTLHTVRGSGTFLRGLAAQAAAQKDHGGPWAQVQEALNSGRHDLRRVGTCRAEGKAGVRTKLESVQEHVCLSQYDKDEKGRMRPLFATRNVGSVLEFQATINWDDAIDLELAHEFHPLPPQAGRAVMLDPGSKQKQDFPIEDLHVQQTVTTMHVENGGTQWLSLLRPPGAEAGDELIATFLQCDVVPQSTVIKEKGPPLAQMLASVPKNDSKEMYTRSFRVAPAYVSTEAGGETAEPKERKTAKELLEDAGISFPEGTMLSRGGAGELVVRNTQENLDKVEQYVKWSERENRPVNVVMTSHVLEAPGPLVRQLLTQMGGRCNHRAELDQLLAAVQQGKAKHLGISRIETQTGSRGRAEQGVQHPFLTEALASDLRLVGFRTEVQVSKSAPHAALGLTLSSEFHPAAPSEHREYVIDAQGRRVEFPLTDFHVMKLTTETVVPDGNARLLAVWKPVGTPEWEKADLLQVLFITCDEVSTSK